ncbi:hypothetical protein XENOCAPTIV_030624 [Xenoophorus captivus]|uniref:KASH5-like coiled-coil domain-containing protein n=1 Tax=Xenoophorus captivus TaxID=1517983 RepID=A0ABV0RXP4_9TELE
MDYCTTQSSRRHNPVDSICRKIQTIQWRGDREPNSPFQIPKLSSSSYDSPQSGLRHNLEAILKTGAFLRDEGERVKAKGMGMPSSAASHSSGLGSYVPLSTPKCNRSTPANVTYTITSTLGERRGADGSDFKQIKTWQRCCSTPTGQTMDSPYFTFTRGPNSVQTESNSHSTSPPLSRTFTPGNSTISYNVNFCSADTTNSVECELETSELVYCVADLQMSNQKLQEEVRKLKQVVENMEESNQKLADENEDLRNQARV